MCPTASEPEPRLRAISGVLEAIDRPAFPAALVAALQRLVRSDRALVYVVRRDASPSILYDQAEPGAERFAFLERVDPYQNALLRGQRGCVTDAGGSDAARGWARGPQVAYLAPVSDDAGVIVLLVRRPGSVGFSAAELGCFRALEAAVCTALRLHWKTCASAQAAPSTEQADLHGRVEAALDRFGDAMLTPREGEVIRLLLRGHSTKAAAERLGIAAATTALHRKRAYAKLGVRSQAQLFHRFIQSLADARRAAAAVPRGVVRELSRPQSRVLAGRP